MGKPLQLKKETTKQTTPPTTGCGYTKPKKSDPINRKKKNKPPQATNLSTLT